MLKPDQAQRLAKAVLVDVVPQPDAGPADSARIWLDSTGENSTDQKQRLPLRIGHCSIIRRMAVGGMGAVYEADQDFPRKRVAVKVIRPGFFSPDALRRFRHEAEILAQLEHPGIASVFYAGTHDDGHGGVPYIVMEYVPNAAAITTDADRRELSDRERVELFLEACDAVHYAHLKGVIHRDLKPGNILVGQADGMPPRVKVIDFGIARAANSDITVTTQHTNTNEVIGTVAYMSPEQTRGKSRDLDFRSDVYSLGVVLYELLCGRLPYDLTDTSTPNALRIIETHEPCRPSTIHRRLRGNLECILLKALEKQPNRRYQSAAELAADLRRYLHGEPVEARKSTLFRSVVKSAIRHPKLATAICCSLMLALTLILTYFTTYWLSFRPHSLETRLGGREARLLSFSGHLLYGWIAQGEQPLAVGPLMSIAHPTRRVAVIGFGCDARNEFPGSVVAFDVHFIPPTRLWSSRVMRDDLLPELNAKHYDPDAFHPVDIRSFDIFMDSGCDGPEIVAIFAHSTWSPRLVRVLSSATGDCLCEFWHDGGLKLGHWMAASRQLVLAGYDYSREVQLTGPDSPATSLHPLKVFAVQPLLGDCGSGWMHQSGKSPSSAVTWTRWLTPSHAALVIDSLEAAPPLPHEDHNQFFRVRVYPTKDRTACLDCLFDSAGEEHRSERIVSDHFKRLEAAGLCIPSGKIQFVESDASGFGDSPVADTTHSDN